MRVSQPDLDDNKKLVRLMSYKELGSEPECRQRDDCEVARGCGVRSA